MVTVKSKKSDSEKKNCCGCVVGSQQLHVESEEE